MHPLHFCPAICKNKPTMAEELEERSRDVLKAVVQEFISFGDPVGSSQLTKRNEFDVSSATMRNVLSELEELGFLEKPHTSAGRIPTGKGYRFFVDSLLQISEPSKSEKAAIESHLLGAAEDAGKMLHLLTHHAGVVLIPRPSASVLSRVEFVRLRDDKVLAILESPNGQVQNKLVSVDFTVTREELVHSANMLNELLSTSASIEDLRGRILQELENQRSQYDALSLRALQLGALATDVSSTERVVIEGTGSFLESKEFSADVTRMRTLFRALDEKHKLLQLLDRVQRAREMQIFIGAESDFSSQGDVTLIASPYGKGDTVLGTVGIIGPTRMNYEKVIPLVHFTAQVLSRQS
jgi:heat-inducible transcriptional repressor